MVVDGQETLKPRPDNQRGLPIGTNGLAPVISRGAVFKNPQLIKICSIRLKNLDSFSEVPWVILPPKLGPPHV